MTVYGLLSDQHCHSWSAFASINGGGENTRLRIILDEMKRAAKEVLAAGGDTLIFAGDLFHVRGSIDPEVFNPTVETIKEILAMGVEIHAIPGNHDLKGQHTTEIGNAIHTLGTLAGFTVHSEISSVNIAGREVWLIPWRSKVSELHDELVKLAGYSAGLGHDVVIHAPVNGVFAGIPDHGHEAKDLAALGFARVFAGHYHNHKVMEGGKVISIGATTHQTWSDVGSKAGFLIVGGEVKFRASFAPAFVEITAATDLDDVFSIVEGNYVRIQGFTLDVAGEKAMREDVMSNGARGVVFNTQRVSAATRSTSAAVKIGSIESSVASYIDSIKGDFAVEIDPAVVQERCSNILTATRSIAS